MLCPHPASCGITSLANSVIAAFILIACIPPASDELTGEEVVSVSISSQQANEEVASTPLPGERQSEDGSYILSNPDATEQATEWMKGLPDSVPEEPPVAQIFSADSDGEVIALGNRLNMNLTYELDIKCCR